MAFTDLVGGGGEADTEPSLLFHLGYFQSSREEIQPTTTKPGALGGPDSLSVLCYLGELAQAAGSAPEIKFHIGLHCLRRVASFRAFVYSSVKAVTVSHSSGLVWGLTEL